MQYDQPPDVPAPRPTPDLGERGRGSSSPLDEIANDLALWIEQMSSEVALAFAPTNAPFSANVSEDQKLQYYRDQFFHPDGTPNPEGRAAQLQRLGVEGFGLVYKAIIRRWPDLKIPTPEPLAVPEQWPHEAPPGAPPGPPPPPPGGPPVPPGGPGPVPPPPMMPPGR